MQKLLQELVSFLHSILFFILMRSSFIDFVSKPLREEELQQQKRNKKRKIKGSSRLSFSEDLDDDSEGDDGENSK